MKRTVFLALVFALVLLLAGSAATADAQTSANVITDTYTGDYGQVVDLIPLADGTALLITIQPSAWAGWTYNLYQLQSWGADYLSSGDLADRSNPERVQVRYLGNHIYMTFNWAETVQYVHWELSSPTVDGSEWELYAPGVAK